MFQTPSYQRVVRARSLLLLVLTGLIALGASGVHGGLVSYWNFDDGVTVTDQFGMNDGTVIYNAGFSSDTPDGSAFSLDLSATGVGPGQDYVRIGPAALGAGEPAGRDLGIADTNSFSIAAWVNYSASQRGIVTIKQDLTSGGGDRSGLTFGIDGSGSPFVGIIASDEIGDAGNGGQSVGVNKVP